MSDTHMNPRLRSRDEEDLRRAELRHANHIRDKKKAREQLRQLQAQRGYLYGEDEIED